MEKTHLVPKEEYPPSDLPPYDASFAQNQPPAPMPYPQGGFVGSPNLHVQPPPVMIQPPPVTIQPAPTNNIVVTQTPLHQPRPSHGFAMCTMIFAAVTLVLTFPSSLLCTIPAMIFSGLALARDYRVDEAKTMSWISLVLTLLYYVCLIIAIIVIVIVVVVAQNNVDPYYPPIHHFSSYEIDSF